MNQDKVSDFLAYLANEKRYSTHTCQAYKRDLADFLIFAQAKNLQDWHTVHAQDLRLFIADLNRHQQSPKSIQRKLSTIRSFYRYLLREGQVKLNPAEGVKTPKAGKRLPKVLDVDQMHSLLNVEENADFAVRDLAMLELFYGCGLRLSELSGLNVNDVDFSECSVKVTGKGSKDRLVPMGKFAKQALLIWLKARLQWAEPEETALFLSQKRKRIANRSIQTRLKKWGQKMGLGSSLHPHRLRHSFASHLLESSGDIRAVQELLGHANLSTTQIYTHLDFQYLAQIYDKAHPRAKKKQS